MTTHAARVIHLFDNSYFSEFGTFGITDRASDAPADLAETFWGADLRDIAERGVHGQKAPCRRDRRISRCCSLSPVWSKPEVLIAGAPAGSAGHDNARVIADRLPWLALNFLAS